MWPTECIQTNIETFVWKQIGRGPGPVRAFRKKNTKYFFTEKVFNRYLPKAIWPLSVAHRMCTQILELEAKRKSSRGPGRRSTFRKKKKFTKYFFTEKTLNYSTNKFVKLKNKSTWAEMCETIHLFLLIFPSANFSKENL